MKCALDSIYQRAEHQSFLTIPLSFLFSETNTCYILARLPAWPFKFRQGETLRQLLI